MKRDRQTAILQLIAKENIATQEALAKRLNDNGFGVTQATVSRDIRDLRLVKVVGNDGQAHYSIKVGLQGMEASEQSSRYNAVLQEAFVSATCAGNLLVVKTVTGMAMAVAASIDSMGWADIIGSIAGDDTIFLAVADADNSKALKDRLERLVHRFGAVEKLSK